MNLESLLSSLEFALKPTELPPVQQLCWGDTSWVLSQGKGHEGAQAGGAHWGQWQSLNPPQKPCRDGAMAWDSPMAELCFPKCNLRPPKRMVHGHGSKQRMPPTHCVGHLAETGITHHSSSRKKPLLVKVVPSVQPQPVQGDTKRSAKSFRSSSGQGAGLDKQLPATAGELGPPPPGETSPSCPILAL